MASTSSTATTCPICNEPILGTEQVVQEHVNRHFYDDNVNSLNEALFRPRPLMEKPIDQLSPAEKMMREVEEADAALAFSLVEQQLSAMNDSQSLHQSNQLITSLNDTAEHCYTNVLGRILPALQSKLSYFGSNSSARRIHLVTDMDYFSSNIAGLGWDCGYRNIQMMFSALLCDPNCRAVMAHSAMKEVPSVPEIAAGIEEAWKKGHDPEGSSRHNGKLVGREVWIGALDVQSFFRSIRINALIADFETPTALDRAVMYDWIYDQFEDWCAGQYCSIHHNGRHANGGSSGATTHWSLIAPMFCQWMGHSITIIGATKSKSGTVSLLVLDPSRVFFVSLMKHSVRMDSLQRGTNHPLMQHPRFQLVYVPPRPRQSSNSNRTRHRHADGSDSQNDVNLRQNSDNRNGSALNHGNGSSNGNSNESHVTNGGGGGRSFLRPFRRGKRQ